VKYEEVQDHLPTLIVLHFKIKMRDHQSQDAYNEEPAMRNLIIDGAAGGA
jgi:hypothetical protein